MFWSDPDVPAIDLCVPRMEELNPDPRTDEDGGFIVACAAACRSMEAAGGPAGICAGLSACRWGHT